MNPIALAAHEYADSSREHEMKAKKEKLSLQDRVAQLELQIENHKAAADRLASFTLHRNGVYQCPRCWIVQEISADLTPIANDDRDDKFRCTRCRLEFVTSA